jgi:hypothetical protein
MGNIISNRKNFVSPSQIDFKETALSALVFTNNTTHKTSHSSQSQNGEEKFFLI